MTEATEARPNGAVPPDQYPWGGHRRGTTSRCSDRLCSFVRMAGCRETGPRPQFLSPRSRSLGAVAELRLGERSSSQSGVARPGRVGRRSRT